jgi:serine/threonine protein kinase
MGLVYAAHDERLDRRVALKLIRNADASEQARKRFWRGARAAAAVTHPGVCQIYEIGEEEGTPYIVMQLLEGESLAERLKRGPLPVVEATQLGAAVLDALEDLHGHGFVHRDLKPSNLFLTAHGVKVLDFGLARLLPSPASVELDETPSQVTEAGALVGTPRYMAPEQLRGGSVDARTDLFALGRSSSRPLPVGTPSREARSRRSSIPHSTRSLPPSAVRRRPPPSIELFVALSPRSPRTARRPQA